MTQMIGVTNLGLSRLFEKNNLKIIKHFKGTWKETPGIFFQDIYILEKKIQYIIKNNFLNFFQDLYVNLKND